MSEFNENPLPALCHRPDPEIYFMIKGLRAFGPVLFSLKFRIKGQS